MKFINLLNESMSNINVDNLDTLPIDIKNDGLIIELGKDSNRVTWNGLPMQLPYPVKLHTIEHFLKNKGQEHLQKTKRFLITYKPSFVENKIKVDILKYNKQVEEIADMIGYKMKKVYRFADKDGLKKELAVELIK
jgi:hypothetical protein